MSIFNRLLGFTLTEDFTETAWWTDGVFRQLERDPSEEMLGDAAAAVDPAQASTELI
jgi:hypothetical protein